eukprot:6940832-Lingulodinium_polyedra.AAC.1
MALCYPRRRGRIQGPRQVRQGPRRRGHSGRSLETDPTGCRHAKGDRGGHPRVEPPHLEKAHAEFTCRLNQIKYAPEG